MLDQGLVALDCGFKIFHADMLMIGMRDQDAPGSVEISLVVAFEIRYISAIVDDDRFKA